ncbi:MAG: protein phosphatase 2C domain-containing protein, partial [Candidatus Methylacidiphilales bacterium]
GDAPNESRSGVTAGSPGQDTIDRAISPAAAATVTEVKSGPADKSWLFTSCSVRGTSHERKGMPNQDFVQISCERNGPPLPIRVALADGHGSQRSFRSQVGSQLAVQAALEEMLVMQKAGLLERTSAEVEEACKSYWGNNVWKRWQKSVLDHIRQNPFTEKDFQNHPDLLPAEPKPPVTAPALPGIKMSGDHLPFRSAPSPSAATAADDSFFNDVLPEDWVARDHDKPLAVENSAQANLNMEAGPGKIEPGSSVATDPATTPPGGAVANGSASESGTVSPVTWPSDSVSSTDSEELNEANVRKTRRLPRPLPTNGAPVRSAEMTQVLARLLSPDNEEDPPIEWFVAYGSTILAVIITERWLFISQLGDGDILLVDDTGHVTRPLPQDKKLFANETTSLCCPDADGEFRLKVLSLEQFSPSVILLATDGYANSFQSDEGFLQVGTDIWNIICECGFDVIPRDIESWLRDASREGSGDDISVGILCRANLGTKPAPAPSPPA